MSVPIAVVPNARVDSASAAEYYPTTAFSFSPRDISAFGGSPMSIKTGSFQNRFYPGGSPGHNLGPIAMPQHYHPPPAHSHGSSIPTDDLCRNYTCCGTALPDLHALVEHFESVHVEVELWSPPSTSSPQDTPSPESDAAFDADDMDMDESPPPQTPTSSSSSTSAFDPVRVSAFRAPYTSSYSSLAGANGPAPSSSAAAFNRYAGYAEWSSALPGTEPSPAYAHDAAYPWSEGKEGTCVTPALLFSSSASPSPLTTPASSRTTTPAPVLPLHPHPPSASHPSLHTQTQAQAKRPMPASMKAGTAGTGTLPSKPFRCPKPNCNKSYKQQNGLKYHLSHGSCNFSPRDPAVELLSESERERRLRPFVCAVGGVAVGGGTGEVCGRRYKNMNGLRYHYTHTGEHGARGLEMLAQGVHPLPDLGPSSSHPSPKTGSGKSTPSTTPPPTLPQSQPQIGVTIPQGVPSQQQQQRYFQPAPSPLAPFPVRAWE